MIKIINFLEKLNELTNQTGVVIDIFGDEFYNPTLSDTNDKINNGQEVFFYFSYDYENQTYVCKLDDPYDGKVIFPEHYPENQEKLL